MADDVRRLIRAGPLSGPCYPPSKSAQQLSPITRLRARIAHTVFRIPNLLPSQYRLSTSTFFAIESPCTALESSQLASLRPSRQPQESVVAAPVVIWL